jgi:hypothetical protein
MSVVLRCPNCGTTQAHAGECEACSDGEVRYFCANHDVGIWLEGPVCSRCGAKLGDAPPKAPASRAPRGPASPAGAPDFRPPRRGAPARPLDSDSGTFAPGRAEREEPAEAEVLRREPSLGELLEDLVEERARAGRRYEAEAPWAEPAARRPGFPLGGCLVRVVGLVFLLIAAAIISLFVLFRGFIG